MSNHEIGYAMGELFLEAVEQRNQGEMTDKALRAMLEKGLYVVNCEDGNDGEAVEALEDVICLRCLRSYEDDEPHADPASLEAFLEEHKDAKVAKNVDNGWWHGEIPGTSLCRKCFGEVFGKYGMTPELVKEYFDC